MKLSENFSLSEFTKSRTAIRKGISNIPNEQQLSNLKLLAKGLQNVRTTLDGFPILISSGFRCLELNRSIGSRDASQHVAGLAADFTCPGYGNVDSVYNTLINADHLGIDQIIREYNSWIHLSFPAKGEEPRGQKLIIDHKGVRVHGS